MPRKYQKGEAIIDLNTFDEQEFVWVYGKVYHEGWAKSWQYGHVTNLIRKREVFKATNIKNKEEQE